MRAPKEKIRLGIIGAGPMGSANLRQCLKDKGVTLTAVCDVQQHRIDAWTKKHPAAKGYRDYRELLASSEVDAVIIASTPHWHCLQAVEAARAGKHIFLQKPMTLYPAESIAVRNAVRKHGVICQVGTQIHQVDNYRRVVDWIRSGKLGEIGRVETFWAWNQGRKGIGKAKPQAIPADVDWDLFCGPAGPLPFNPFMIKDAATHCAFKRLSGGWTPGMAPHIVDLPIWALELGLPEKISAMGGRYFVQDDGDIPDTQDIIWQYPNLTMRWHFSLFNHHGYEFGSRSRALGVYFHGLNGTLRANYNEREIIPQNSGLNPDDEPARETPAGTVHEHEWLNGIRAGEQPSCSVEYHFKVDYALALGNLSHELGRTITIDPATEAIVGDDEAAKAAIPEYHGSWEFPVEYLND